METKLTQLDKKAQALGYIGFHVRGGYEFRAQTGNQKFTVKNIEQAHIMLDMIARVPSAETTAQANHWLHLSKDTTASTVELNAIAKSVMQKIAGIQDPEPDDGFVRRPKF